MPNQTLARRYATAVFQLAEEAGKSTEIQRDLHGFVAALDAEPEIRKFFVSPVVDRVEKSELVAKAFAKLDPIALHTMLLIIRKRREGLVDEIVAQYDLLAQAARGARPLEVVSARPLSKTELAALVALGCVASPAAATSPKPPTSLAMTGMPRDMASRIMRDRASAHSDGASITPR